MVAYSFTQVLRKNLMAEYQVGGQGYRWMDRVRFAMHKEAEVLAAGFTRSGEILRSHRSEVKGLNQWACGAIVYNTAEHALWKHNGTVGPIYPDGRFLFIPAGYGHGAKRLRSVRGQAGQPWLDDACSMVAMGYGAVRYA